MSTASLQSRRLFLKYNLTVNGVTKSKNQTMSDLKPTITDDNFVLYRTEVAKLLVDNLPIAYRNDLYSVE